MRIFQLETITNMVKVKREFAYLYENSLLSKYKIERLNLVTLYIHVDCFNSF